MPLRVSRTRIPSSSSPDLTLPDLASWVLSVQQILDGAAQKFKITRTTPAAGEAQFIGGPTALSDRITLASAPPAGAVMDILYARPDNLPKERPFGIVSVYDFGAVGDGETDDSEAIQAAIDAVAGMGGGVVYVPPGVYIAKARIHSNVHLTGAGYNSVLKLPPNSVKSGTSPEGQPSVVTNSDWTNGNTGIAIINLRFDGNKANQSNVGTEHDVINLARCNKVFISHCWVHDGAADGIDLDGGQQHVITNCHIWDCNGTAVHNAGGTIEYKGWLEISKYNIISHCTSYRNGLVRPGVAFDANGRTIVMGCISLFDYEGLQAAGWDNILVNNLVVQPRRRGAFATGSGSYRNIIRGNIIVNANESQEADGAAISLDADVGSGWWIEDNLIVSGFPDSYGILIRGGRDIHVRQNFIGTVTLQGIAVQTADDIGRSVFEGNRIVNCYRSGLVFTDVARSGLRIVGNIIVDNGSGAVPGDRNGMLLRGVQNSLIEGNIVQDTGVGYQQYGIRITGTIANGNHFANNILLGNVIANMSLTGSHTFRDNIGYVTARGGTASVADGGTIAHGLVGTPTKFSVQATVAGHIATATADGVNLTVALKNHDGSSVATPEPVVWWAEI